MPARRSITHQQKVALRKQRLLRPKATNLELRRWFQDTYLQPIAPSSVSEILGPRYQHLDTDIPLPSDRNPKRTRTEKWPDLEEALYQWCLRSEESIIITQEILRVKVQFFWQNLLQYQDQEMPTFSNGWLFGFQQRRSIKFRQQHGEAGAIPVEAEQEMVEVRSALGPYAPCDTYNCDETALFWKLVPDRGLSTKSVPGRKKEKARITGLFCCNADGSDRLPIWFVGTAKKPRAFAAAGVNVNHLNMVWKSNRIAWMTAVLFEEYLRWFDKRMTGRKVVLLMDNFSAHTLAYQKICESQEPLQNTFVVWLPANSTSRYQPLDQGIIKTWKAYWRRQWVFFLLQEFEAGREPLASMNVLRAVRWGIQIWDLDVTAKAISNCFRKALTSDTSPEPAPEPAPEPVSELTKSLQQLELGQHIPEVMDVTEFLEPEGEKVEDSAEDIDASILAQFAPEDEEDSDDDQTPERIIPAQEALQAVQLLRLYHEQSGGNTDLILELNRQERELLRKRDQSMQQTDIRAFFCT